MWQRVVRQLHCIDRADTYRQIYHLMLSIRRTSAVDALGNGHGQEFHDDLYEFSSQTELGLCLDRASTLPGQANTPDKELRVLSGKAYKDTQLQPIPLVNSTPRSALSFQHDASNGHGAILLSAAADERPI